MCIRDSGSWNVDYEKTFRNGPVDVGFDEAFFILASLDMPPYLYLRGDRAEQVPTIERGFPHNEYNDYQRVGAAAEDFEASECLYNLASESRSFIKRQAANESGKPFFLYLPLTSPHTPIRPGKAFKEDTNSTAGTPTSLPKPTGSLSRCLSSSKSRASKMTR